MLFKNNGRKKSAVIANPKAFTALYAISSKSLDENTEFNVDEGASKGQITKAFKKMLGSKSTNKNCSTHSSMSVNNWSMGVTQGTHNRYTIFIHNTQDTCRSRSRFNRRSRFLPTENCGTEVNTKQLFT